MPKNSFIIGGAAVILIAASVALVGLNSRPQPKEAGVGVSVAEKSIANKLNPVANSAAGWKVYQNKQYGFEVKYPADWVAVPNYQWGTDNYLGYSPIISFFSLEFYNKAQVIHTQDREYWGSDLDISVTTVAEFSGDLHTNLKQSLQERQAADSVGFRIGDSGTSNGVEYTDVSLVGDGTAEDRLFQAGPYVYILTRGLIIEESRVVAGTGQEIQEAILASFRVRAN